jgi:alginate O-acetyltransferase complex protein AlgI
VEWCSKNHEHPFIGKFKSIYLTVTIFLIIILGVYSDHSDFIYFQF